MQRLIRGYALIYPNGDLVGFTVEGYPMPAQRFSDIHIYGPSDKELALADRYRKMFPRENFTITPIEIEVRTPRP